MGILKKIFWPDHPDEVAARKNVKDIAARDFQRQYQQLGLEKIWAVEMAVVDDISAPNWITEYDRYDKVDNYDSLVADQVQDQESFESLVRRVPEDIRTEIPRHAKPDVVRDYWASVTAASSVDLFDLGKRLEFLTIYRSPLDLIELQAYNSTVVGFLLADLAARTAEAGFTRSLWDLDETNLQKWQKRLDTIQIDRQMKLTQVSQALRALAASRPDTWELFGYTLEMTQYLGAEDVFAY